MNLKIIFLGTPEFGAIILDGLVNSGYKPALVVTETDKPVGRKQIITPPLVKVAALRYNLKIVQPDKILNLKSEILNLKPDLGVVAAYGQIIPKEILDIPKYGFLNVHPSLLPKYRGPSPIQYAILNGEEKTGVTIMQIAEKVDSGPIVAQEEITIEKEYTYETLHNKLAVLGVKLLVDNIYKYINKEIKPMAQDDSKATYTKILKKENGKIDWQKPAEEIKNQITAFGREPGTYTECGENKFGIKTIKISKASVQEQTKNSPKGVPGKTYLATNEKIAVQTGKDFLIIEEIQPESGKRMPAKEFLLGRPDFIGTILK